MNPRETRTDSEGLGGTRLPEEHCAVQCMFLRELQACIHVIISGFIFMVSMRGISHVC